MARPREQIRDALRRWRLAREHRRRVMIELRDERNAAHLERVRAGIKDVPMFPSAGI